MMTSYAGIATAQVSAQTRQLALPPDPRGREGGRKTHDEGEPRLWEGPGGHPISPLEYLISFGVGGKCVVMSHSDERE